MAYEDLFAAGRRESNASRPETGAGVPGEVSLALSQLSKQIAESRNTRRGMPGILAYPVLLIGVAALFAMAKPWLTTKCGGRAAYAPAPHAQTDFATPGHGNLSGLVLNATCITGDQRLTIINGRVYKEKDTLDEPGAVAAPCVIAEIQPHKVLLDCRGIRMQLCYADTAAPAPNADRPNKLPHDEALPPEFAPAAGAEPLNLLLDKAQKGGVGLETVLSVLSGTKK